MNLEKNKVPSKETGKELERESHIRIERDKKIKRK